MWTVQFKEYLNFNGVKESIENVKQIRKSQRKELKSAEYGQLVEETVTKIVSDYKGFVVKTLAPQMDMGFGADIQVSYKDQDKNYSFFVDITSTQKVYTKYLSVGGATTENIKDAFCYSTEYFNVYFGIKERHKGWFFYEKPVVILYIQNFVPTTGLALSHINNIASLMMSANNLLLEQGYGARASQRIRPNPNRFMEEYQNANQ